MVSDRQVRLLMKRLRQGEPLSRSATRAGMDEKTARKYRDSGLLPSEQVRERDWRTRKDPFEDVWVDVQRELEETDGLRAKTLFDLLQRQQPGRFGDGQLRTFQRRVRQWRALDGPGKEVFFAQEHHPGELGESDFTEMGSLNVTIAGQPFPHLLYHFVLTYSNWETGTICFSESMESLSTGLQNALFELRGVPQRHRSDRMSAAVNNGCVPEEFTRRYQALLDHFDLKGEKTRAGKGNENGDVEQLHHRFKDAVDQELLLRKSRDFATRAEYEGFLRALFERLNAGRRTRFEEERAKLQPLPERRLEDCKRIRVVVASGSTIRVQHNTYSVHSRLIGEEVEARVFAEHLEVWYAQRRVETLPRLLGRYRHRIDYRHVIDSLVRKPGAFENYRYREDLFPSSHFRLAYDQMRERHAPTAAREYLRILKLAADEGEARVEGVLRRMLAQDEPLAWEPLEHRVKADQQAEPPTEVKIAAVDLAAYDELCPAAAEEVAHE